VQLPPLWAAAIVFVPKLWAVFWDPVVGAWSDRARGRFGRRRPFLVIGATGMAITFVALFCTPPLSVPASAIWIGCAYFALATLYSLFAVPYIAVAPEVGSDAAERARLVRWRIFVAMIGVLAGAALAPWLVSSGGGGRGGYAVMAIALASSCWVCGMAPLWMLRRFDRSLRPQWAEARPPASELFRMVLRRSDFLWLSAAYLTMLTAVGVISASAPYLVAQVLDRPERDAGTALGLMLVTTILTISAWSALSRRLGEWPVLAVALAAYAVLSSALGVQAREGSSWAVTLCLFGALGAPFAAAQVLPFTLLAHLIHAEVRGRRGAEGVFTGLWTAAEKVGLALGPGLTGIALAVFGGPRLAIPLLVLVVPALLMLIALIPLYRSRSAAESARRLHALQ